MHKKGNLKEVIQVSWPLVMGMLSFTIMDLTDTLMVGQLGIAELAAVGMSTAVMFAINAFFIGFFESIKIFVSQATGANQRRIAKKAGWQGLFIAIPAGIAVVFLALLSQDIFAFFGGPKNIQILSSAYFVLRLWASPFWFITLALSSFYQGTGNMKLPMQVNLFMCVFNVISSQILIFGLGPLAAYGIAGSAYATILSNVLGAAIILGFFFKNAWSEKSFEYNIIQKLIYLGVPVGIRWLLDTGGWTIVVAMVARLGTEALAANQIATKIMSLALLPVYGISEAACILAGQATGAEDIPALKRSYISALQIGVTIMTVMGLIFILVPLPLVSLFQKNTAVLQHASAILMLVGAYQVLSAFSLITAGALNGAGDTRFTMVLILLSTWFVMVPGAYLFGIRLGLGVFGMWAVLIAHETILVLGTQWRYHSGKWKNHQAISLHKH